MYHVNCTVISKTNNVHLVKLLINCGVYIIILFRQIDYVKT